MSLVKYWMIYQQTKQPPRPFLADKNYKAYGELI